MKHGAGISRGILPYLLVSATVATADGAGFLIPNQSTEATARGNAWVATADSAAAVHYNPAGLVQLGGQSAEIGVYTIHLGNKVRINGTRYEADREWQAVPHLYYSHAVNEDLVLGFGLNSPFGLGTDWGGDTPFRQLTTNTELTYIRGSAVAAYRVNECWSIGGGLSLNYADATFDRGLAPYNPTSPVPQKDKLRFEGDDLDFSWIISLLYRPHEQHSFGAVFRSKSEFDLDGNVKSTPGYPAPNGDAKLDFLTPASAAVGYAYTPMPKLTIEANVEWVDWDNVNTLTLKTPAGNLPVPFEWESTFIYEIGLTYRINEHYEASIGYDYNEGAQPDLYYNPGVADADRHWFNVGISRRADAFNWQFAYQLGLSDHKVDGSVVGTNGKYDAEHHALMFSGRFDF
jgi:long-chain fatty acid transport protein